MPRDAVAHTAVVSGVTSATPETVTITPANGATIAAVKDAARLLVRIQNTTAATKKVTIKAGVNPPALRAGLGDLVITMLEKTDEVIVIESARFSQVDGTVLVDFEAGMTGKISAIRLPKGT